jgi:hypothetical protein
MVLIELKSGEYCIALAKLRKGEGSSLVDRRVILHEYQAWICVYMSIKGIICSQYASLVIKPHAFSHNKRSPSYADRNCLKISRFSSSAASLRDPLPHLVGI